MASKIYATATEAEFKLRDIGLARAGLLSAVRASVAAVAGCTADSPPIAPGWMAWYSAVVRLRQEFRPSGWEADDTANFSTIVDHAGSVRVAVANTDDATGNPTCDPTNRSRRGELSRLAVEANQWLLPYPGWETDTAIADSQGFATWYLCIYVAGGKVRAELSLPTSCEGGYFGGWSERVMLISNDDDWTRALSPVDSDQGPDFEVHVARK